MEKAVGYIRVSTSNQARDGYSLAYQEEEIKRYAAENNLDLIGIYQDSAKSGDDVDTVFMIVEREGLQQMLYDIRFNGAKYVIVLNTSRLWRSDIAKVIVQKELKRANVDVTAIEQPSYSIYKKDPADILVNGMLELLDSYSRLEITMKLAKGRRKKAEGGGYSGGKPPFGYTVKKGQKQITVDLAQAEIVRRVFTLKEEYSAMSLAQIASKINSESFKTREGKEFTKTQIKRILDNRAFYCGEYSYGQVKAQGQHVAII